MTAAVADAARPARSLTLPLPAPAGPRTGAHRGDRGAFRALGHDAERPPVRTARHERLCVLAVAAFAADREGAADYAPVDPGGAAAREVEP